MSNARFVKEIVEGVAASKNVSMRRKVPVTTGRGDPTEALAGLLAMWPPEDVRLDMKYRETHSVTDTSELWVKDVVRAVRLREERRLPGAGVVEIAVDFPSNMAEYERYNSVVESHNTKWVDAGSPSDKIDPWSGDISDVEGYVDFARPSDDIPHCGDGGGPLDSCRPSPVRSQHMSVEYRASEHGDLWTLGFVARDQRGRALCWNEESGRDLAALVRRSVQMLYGNPLVFGDEGPLSDGLPMLVQGRKTSMCSRRNTRPSWMDCDVKSGPSPEYIEAKLEEIAGKTGHTLLGFWVPIASVIGMFVWAAHCINQTWGTPQGPHAGMWWFVGGELALCAVLWLSSAIATHAQRSAEGARMRSAYL
jgi:hypothetical protein